MFRKLTLCCFVALSACSLTIPDFRTGPMVAPQASMSAPVIPRSATERFIETAAANGCEVNQTNSAAILAGATLSRDDLARIMTELKADGRGQIAADGASFRVMTGACA
ncbi:hypothetical protein N9E38_00385 [Yoonia sp.]|nr:hypothetical protein [Yoonia sp.]MDC1399392.1 hypothetical protein [Yoonia sp.]